MYCVDKLARPFVLLNILFFQFRCCDERHFLYNTIITLHHWPIAISLLMAFRYILLVAYNSTYFIHWIQDHFTAFRKCDYCQSFVWSGAFGVLNVYYVLSSCVQIYIIKQKKKPNYPIHLAGIAVTLETTMLHSITSYSDWIRDAFVKKRREQSFEHIHTSVFLCISNVNVRCVYRIYTFVWPMDKIPDWLQIPLHFSFRIG